MGGQFQYPQRNRMAYTLNLPEDNSYTGNIPKEMDYFPQRGSRVGNRPNSMVKQDNMYNPRPMEMGRMGMGMEEPRYPNNFEELNNYRGSMGFVEKNYNRGMDIPQNHQPEMGMNMTQNREPEINMNINQGGIKKKNSGFDAAKKLEKYKNQMNMKFGGEGGYGGRFY